MTIRAATAAATVTGDRRKLHQRSLSSARRSVGGSLTAAATGTTPSANAHSLVVDPQPRVDHVIEKIDAEIDEDKKEADQH